MTDLLDLEPIRRDLISGKLRWSSKCPEMVELVRRLVKQFDSCRALGAELSVPGRVLTRNAIVSFCRRAKPPIEVPLRYEGGNGFAVINADPERKRAAAEKAKATRAAKLATRRARQKASNNLSTHQVRLMRKINENRAVVEGKGRPPAAPVLNAAPFPFHDFSMARTVTKKFFEPRCCWTGCSKPPRETGKPFCDEHHVRSGALIR